MFCASHTYNSYAVQCVAYTKIQRGESKFVLSSFFTLFLVMLKRTLTLTPSPHVASCFVYSFVAMTMAPLLQGSLPFQCEEE